MPLTPPEEEVSQGRGKGSLKSHPRAEAILSPTTRPRRESPTPWKSFSLKSLPRDRWYWSTPSVLLEPCPVTQWNGVSTALHPAPRKDSSPPRVFRWSTSRSVRGKRREGPSAPHTSLTCLFTGNSFRRGGPRTPLPHRLAPFTAWRHHCATSRTTATGHGSPGQGDRHALSRPPVNRWG